MAKSVRIYPNGMPHLSNKVRQRMVIELLVLAISTCLYISFHPERNLGVDIGLALAALGLVGISAKDTRNQVWGPPTSAKFIRIRRCITNMTLATAPTIIIFGIYGAIVSYIQQGDASGIGYRLFRLNFFIALLLYLPWALIQQTLFQFYLLGRLRAILPFASPLLLSVINGILYGAVHLPDWPVSLVTICGGVLWSYSYHKDRLTVPIALSHALLAVTFFYWVQGTDLVQKNLSFLPWL